MPQLSRLTDAYADQPETIDGLPVEPLYLPNVNTNDITVGGNGVSTRITVRPQEPDPAFNDFNTSVGTKLDDMLNKLTGANEQQRYQLWPEKVVTEGSVAAHNIMKEGSLPPGLRREDFTDIPDPSTLVGADNFAARTGGSRAKNLKPSGWQPVDDIIEKAQAISALAGTGGLAGTTDATLGATPFLRPALKYKDKIYKGKEGQQHQDVIPKELYPEFEQMAMNGEDISHYNFGFMNHKGQFLDREKALEYAINEGLVDAHAGQYGALTSTLMADSSKPGVAIEAMGKTNLLANTAKEHFGITHNPKEAGYVMSDGSMLDLSGRHYSGGYTKAPDGTWKLKVSEKDWMKDQRQVDHRELDFMDQGGTEGMRQFMNGSGAIRNQPGIGFDTTVVPTDKQLTKIISSHNAVYKGEPLKVDISNPQTGDNLASKDFSKANVEAVKKWIQDETAKYPDFFLKADSSKESAALQAMHKGFPLFSKGGHMLVPVDHEPDFGDK